MSDRTKSIISNVLYIAAVLLISFLIVRFVGQRTEVIGSSMVPTLQDGNQLITDKISYRFGDPKRFDIIVFPHEPDHEFYIKRIILFHCSHLHNSKLFLPVKLRDGSPYFDGLPDTGFMQVSFIVPEDTVNFPGRISELKREVGLSGLSCF